VRTTSSAKVILSEIKRHKRGAFLVLAVLVMTLAALISIWVSNRSARPATTVTVKSIAVLPFKPLAADSRNEELELGMADTLITKLSGIRQLIVRPMSSIRKYTSLEQDPIEAGRELGVDYVLEGSLQMDGEKTRATVRLWSVKDEAAIWSDRCDEQCSTIFELQDAIAEQIAAGLAIELTGEERKRLAEHYTESTDAYRAYLWGRHLLYKRTGPTTEKSIEYFKQAIDLDPNYAHAYADLAYAYIRLAP
jgi:serine/threonine-protein kinase